MSGLTMRSTRSFCRQAPLRFAHLLLRAPASFEKKTNAAKDAQPKPAAKPAEAPKPKPAEPPKAKPTPAPAPQPLIAKKPVAPSTIFDDDDENPAASPKPRSYLAGAVPKRQKDSDDEGKQSNDDDWSDEESSHQPASSRMMPYMAYSASLGDRQAHHDAAPRDRQGHARVAAPIA
jgi:outer membrane biosynthesis protein TonB